MDFKLKESMHPPKEEKKKLKKKKCFVKVKKRAHHTHTKEFCWALQGGNIMLNIVHCTNIVL